jgi:hypothetical protein
MTIAAACGVYCFNEIFRFCAQGLCERSYSLSVPPLTGATLEKINWRTELVTASRDLKSLGLQQRGRRQENRGPTE